MGNVLSFFDEMTAMKMPLSKEVCLSLISAYCRQAISMLPLVGQIEISILNTITLLTCILFQTL